MRKIIVTYKFSKRLLRLPVHILLLLLAGNVNVYASNGITEAKHTQLSAIPIEDVLEVTLDLAIKNTTANTLASIIIKPQKLTDIKTYKVDKLIFGTVRP